MNKIIIGTRSSQLAVWQADFVMNRLQRIISDSVIELKYVKTLGDKILDSPLSQIGGKGLFTKELEKEILNKKIDLAVHSLKDLPTELPEGLSIAAVMERHDVRDVLLSKSNCQTIKELKNNAVVATGSVRRQAQILHLRPDLKIVDLRGNINTRIKKYLDSDWDAMLLAAAGVKRLGLNEYISSYIETSEILPAAGQGALAIECLSNNPELLVILSKLNHSETFRAVEAERSFLKALGGGCQTPIAVYAYFKNKLMIIEGLIVSPDGKKLVRDKLTAQNETPKELGEKLAGILMNKGGKEIINV